MKKSVLIKSLCIVLVLCLSVFLFSGSSCSCNDDNNIAAAFTFQSVSVPNSVFTADGAFFNVQVWANNVTVNMDSSADISRMTVTENHPGTVLNMGQGSVIGLLELSSPATVHNQNGTINNAVVYPEGSGTEFDKMPEKLVIKPGAWVMVGSVKYDNTNGTEDMVLPVQYPGQSNNKKPL